MQAIAIVMQKGGAGKTTLAVNLATALSGPTVLLDCDPQGSAVKVLGHRELPVVRDCGFGVLERNVAVVRDSGAAFCVIDTPPQLEQALIAAARLADLVLAPVRPTRLDLQSWATTVATLKLVGVTPITILSQVPTLSAVKLIEQTRKAVPGLAQTVIYNRRAYQYALAAGQGVTEFEPDGKAADEIRSLIEELSLG